MIYPSWRYHRTERAVIVNDPLEDEALSAAGWADTPAAFDAIDERPGIFEPIATPAHAELWWMKAYSEPAQPAQYTTRAQRRAAAKAAKEAK